jgi:hypothetical protein
MKKLLYSLLFILIGLFFVDRIGGMAMQWVNRNTQDVLGPKFKYIHDEINEDVVLIGASRCHHHYVSSILADTLGMSVYNCGIQGSENIYSHYMTLCLILARHKPKVICVEMMVSDFNQQKDPFAKLTMFAPYFGYDESADSLFCTAGLYWKYNISHLYRYNAKATSNIAGLFVSRQKKDDHGYLPIKNSSVILGELTTSKTTTDIDKQKIHYLHLFVKRCKSEKIQIVFTVSPRYAIVDSSYYSVLKDFAREENIPFLDYHTPGVFLDHPEYFRDRAHLNDKGARLYSTLFSHDFKLIIEQ